EVTACGGEAGAFAFGRSVEVQCMLAGSQILDVELDRDASTLVIADLGRADGLALAVRQLHGEFLGGAGGGHQGGAQECLGDRDVGSLFTLPDMFCPVDLQTASQADVVIIVSERPLQQSTSCPLSSERMSKSITVDRFNHLKPSILVQNDVPS